MKLEIDPRVIKLLSYVITHDNKPIPHISNNTIQEFRSQKLPASNVDKDTIMNARMIMSKAEKFTSAAGHLLGASQWTNALVYPPMSIMKWHTNADMPGTRTYYTYTEGRAIFRYYLDGEYYEDEDNIGWTARQFVIDPEKPLWHTVWTEKHRYAFGFNTLTPT